MLTILDKRDTITQELFPLEYKTLKSAGFDIPSYEAGVVPPHDRAVFSTGLHLDVDKTMALDLGGMVIYPYLAIVPRSGLAFKQGITVLNTPVTIDSDYEGEMKVVLYNTTSEPFTVEVGDRIAQGILMLSTRVGNVGEANTVRGDGGFGSTGK